MSEYKPPKSVDWLVIVLFIVVILGIVFGVFV